MSISTGDCTFLPSPRMSLLTSFDKESLALLLNDVRSGALQLPDFQRGWVWDDAHVRSLLASISLSFPVGAAMMLQTGNPDVRFRPRLVEGVVLPKPREPERLILDGQQRLTSLYQALVMGKPVETRDARGLNVSRWYYLDIKKALAPGADREESIFSVPGDRVIRNFRGEVDKDYSTVQNECLAGVFPLRLVFDQPALTEWQMCYLQAGGAAELPTRLEWWSALFRNVIEPFQQYQIPVILLRKETPKEAVCLVFEKVNTGGVSLTVFELLTATFAAEDYALRDDWAERKKRMNQHAVLHGLENSDFLQTVTLLASYERSRAAVGAVTAKRADMLRLTLSEYRKWAEPATLGYLAAARLLYSQHLFAARDLPYRTQLVPLAAVLALLGESGEVDGVRRKLVRWYWCGVFGELYGSAIESRFAKDLPELLEWIQGGGEPSTIQEANFPPARLHSLRTRNSAAYKGLYALLMRDGGRDFRTGESIEVQQYFDERIDIHHIFPQAWCIQQRISSTRFDSIVNKTALSARTNRSIGGSAPSIYLSRVQRSAEIDDARMDAILGSHLIDSSALRRDDFDAFYAGRTEALLQRIEAVMGKPIARMPVGDPESPVVVL